MAQDDVVGWTGDIRDITIEPLEPDPSWEEYLDQLKTGEITLPVVRFVDSEAGVTARYMPVPRCETCQWWENAWPDALNPPSPGEGHCTKTAIDPVWRPENPPTKAVVEEPGGALKTTADFGCVQWEVRE